MVVGRFGFRAVVDKGGETCDQGGVFDGGVCLVAIVSSQEFKQFRVFLCYSPSSVIAERGLVGRVAVVAVIAWLSIVSGGCRSFWCPSGR